MVYSTIPYMHVAYVVLALSSCSTNGLLVWIIFRKRRLRTNSNIIIASLSISDFLLGATIAPVEVAHTLQTTFTIVGYGCLAHQVMMIYIPLVSILHLLVVALERFVKIVYSLRYVNIITKNRVAVLIVLAWTFPLCVSVVPFTNSDLFSTGNASDQSCSTLDLLSCPYIAFVFTVIGTTCILMTVLYGILLKIACRHAMEIRCINVQICKQKSTNNKRELKIVGVLIVTVGYFIISWTPFTVAVFEQCISSRYPPYWYPVVFLAYFNSTVNPMIYGIGNRDLRMSLMELCFGRKHDAEIPSNLTKVTTIAKFEDSIGHTAF